MANISNLKVAAGSLVTFGGVDLGHTVDGAEIEIEREHTELQADIYGNTAIDYVLTGQHASVTLRLAEIVPGTLRYLLHEGSFNTGGSGDNMFFGTKSGYSLRNDALELVITPQGSNSDDSMTITLFKAVSQDNVSWSYKIDDQTVFEATFQALVDESHADGQLLGRLGPADIS